MINTYFYIFVVPVILLINFILKKNKFLLNYTGQEHQTYTIKDQIPLSGGLFILVFFMINYESLGSDLFFYLFFFSLGLFADLNVVKSPTHRFICQILFIILFVIYLNISIEDIRINFVNLYLQNYYFNIFFVSFCFLVLVNGSNFIDGNNGLSIGYFCIIFFNIINLNNNEIVLFENSLLLSFLIILIIILFFNFSNKLYLGDNGVYLLSVYTGYTLINLFNNNPNISPYFIVNLLWYPAFEILFSMLRKLKLKHSPMKPDTLHLHQLLFFYYVKKLKLKKNISNSATGFTINIYNAIILYVSSISAHHTNLQILFIAISTLIYLFSYLSLLKIKNSLFNKKL